MSFPAGAILRHAFLEALTYRAELLTSMLGSTIPLVSLVLWTTVTESAPVGRLTADRFVAYFVAVAIVRQLTSSSVLSDLDDDIRSGGLSRRLLRPHPPLLAYAAESLAVLPVRVVLTLPLVLGALAFMEPRAVAPTSTQLFVGAASLLGAWLLNFALLGAIASLGFFFESATILSDVWSLAFLLLSGFLLPLELFPPALRALCDVLPFRYTLAFPVENLTGLSDMSRAARDLSIQWAWVASATLCATLLFRSGVRRYTAFGG